MVIMNKVVTADSRFRFRAFQIVIKMFLCSLSTIQSYLSCQIKHAAQMMNLCTSSNRSNIFKKKSSSPEERWSLKVNPLTIQLFREVAQSLGIFFGKTGWQGTLSNCVRGAVQPSLILDFLFIPTLGHQHIAREYFVMYLTVSIQLLL